MTKHRSEDHMRRQAGQPARPRARTRTDAKKKSVLCNVGFDQLLCSFAGDQMVTVLLAYPLHTHTDSLAKKKGTFKNVFV